VSRSAGNNRWAWFIPIDKEVFSLGLVLPGATFLETKQTPEEFFHATILEINPDLRRRLADIKLVEKFHVIPNYSYQVRRPSRRSNWAASPVIDSPIWKRGNASCSRMIGLMPSRIRHMAAVEPPSPPPIMSTSVLIAISLLTVTKTLANKEDF
jgi:hypothetical protein